MRSFAGELAEEGLDGGEIIAGLSQHLSPLQAIGARVFGRWADQLPR